MTVDIESQQQDDNAIRHDTPTGSDSSAEKTAVNSEPTTPDRNFFNRLFSKSPSESPESPEDILRNSTTCRSATDLDDCIPGYPKLAAMMGIAPCRQIFRRFTALNAQNLLYLQAELTHLEKNLRRYEKADNTDGTGYKSEYSGDWYSLSRAGEEGVSLQWEAVKRLRKVLKEYNEALVHTAAVYKMQMPSPVDIKDIQYYLEQEEMGPYTLIGADSRIWGGLDAPRSHAPDLLTLSPRKHDDTLSRWCIEKAIFYWYYLRLHKIIKPSSPDWRFMYKESTMLRLTYAFTSIVAAMLPVVSIIVLLKVKTLEAKLGTITAFNLLVSLCLSAFTSAKRAEIFAVTAAFAAVQVVFVGINEH